MSSEKIVFDIQSVRVDAFLSSAAKVQQERELKNRLYKLIHRLIRFYCIRYFSYAKEKGYTENDILSSAWLGVENAISKYEKSANCTFNTFIKFHIYNAVNEFLGFRGATKHPKETISLNEYITTDEKLTLEETISDERATDTFIEKEDKLYYMPLRSEVEKLPQYMRMIIYEYYFNGLSFKELANKYHITPREVKNTKIKALRRLKHNAIIRQNYLNDFAYKHIGVERFKSNNTSSTEWAVLMLEELF